MGSDPVAVPERKGTIGERRDADAGLLYLNARYYDPDLALFLQPDWWEVTEPGVGTNGYAYAGNGPVNGSDPGGNQFLSDLGSAIGGFFSAIGNALSGGGSLNRPGFAGGSNS